MANRAGPSGDGPPGIREFHHGAFSIDRIVAERSGTSVSVCLPARNEAGTVGAIVDTIRRELLDRGAVDEVVVLDDHSTDDTAAVARAAGARVVDAGAVLSDHGDGHGKGEVLWKSLFVTDTDVVIWCDSDIVEFGARFVSGLLGPLVCEPDVDFVKGHYQRPERDREGGGRVTELVARPLLSLFFPELLALHQPLSGEYGGRRSVLERLPFVGGYGVDVGLLMDLSRERGTGGLVQVDLDVRHHRNRALGELGPQATSIIQTVLSRVDRDLVPGTGLGERPPMVELEEYRALHTVNAVD